MAELFKGMAGSPITYLMSNITASQKSITVADDTVLPDAPNICTIGVGENIETIRYGTKQNNVLGDVTRGIEGAPRAWQAGAEVARFFTAYDHNSIIENFNSHLAENVHIGLNEFVRVRRTTNQTIPNNVSTILSYNDIVKNDYGMFNLSSPTNFLCVQNGVYLVTANVRWVAGQGGLRRIKCNVNGQARLEDDRLPTQSITEAILSGTIELSQGDIVTFDVLQNSGGALDIQAIVPYTPSVQIVKVG